jgi:hypothetical protein
VLNKSRTEYRICTVCGKPEADMACSAQGDLSWRHKDCHDTQKAAIPDITRTLNNLCDKYGGEQVLGVVAQLDFYADYIKSRIPLFLLKRGNPD